MSTADFPMRINKYLAQKGVASRREADALIAAGQVTINGRPAAMGQTVRAEDTVKVKGETKTKQYFAYYKGRGIITHSPANGEVDIATRLKKDYDRGDIYPVGRLDKDSEGLIILTNDGRITEPLLDPEAGHEKQYEVWVDKPISNLLVKHFQTGVNIEGYQTKPARVKKHPKNDRRFTVVLTEGKKHQIRRMCAALGYQVQSLKRTRILNIELGKLKPNQLRRLTAVEQKGLLSALNVQQN